MLAFLVSSGYCNFVYKHCVLVFMISKLTSLAVSSHAYLRVRSLGLSNNNVRLPLIDENICQTTTNISIEGNNIYSTKNNVG